MSVDEDPRFQQPYLIGFDSECNDFKGDKLHYGKPDVQRATFIWPVAEAYWIHPDNFYVITNDAIHHKTTDMTAAPVRLPHPAHL